MAQQGGVSAATASMEMETRPDAQPEPEPEPQPQPEPEPEPEPQGFEFEARPGQTVKPELEPEPEVEPGICDIFARRRRKRARQMEMENHDIRLGMNPYIRMRLGANGDVVKTDDIMSTKKSWETHKERYLNPVWRRADNNLLRVVSTASKEDDFLIVEAMHEGGERGDTFLGAARLRLATKPPDGDAARQPHILIPDPAADFPEPGGDDWVDTVWGMVDNELSHDGSGREDDNRDAGGVHVRWRWRAAPPAQQPVVLEESEAESQLPSFVGTLEVEVHSASNLRDMTKLKISDINGFSDDSTTRFVFALLLTYFSCAMMFFSIYLRWYPWNGAFFVLTTFTMVGYGNQGNYAFEGTTFGPALVDESRGFNPEKTLTTAFDKVVMVLFIVVGTGVLGVVVGVLGDAMHKKAQATVAKHMAAAKAKVAAQQAKIRERQRKGQLEDPGSAPRDLGTGNPNVDARLTKKLGKDQSLWTADEVAEAFHRDLLWSFWSEEIFKFVTASVLLAATILFGTLVYLFTERNQLFSCHDGHHGLDGLSGCHTGPEPDYDPRTGLPLDVNGGGLPGRYDTDNSDTGWNEDALVILGGVEYRGAPDPEAQPPQIQRIHPPPGCLVDLPLVEKPDIWLLDDGKTPGLSAASFCNGESPIPVNEMSKTGSTDYVDGRTARFIYSCCNPLGHGYGKFPCCNPELANARYGLRFVDALYLTVVTASSVGFGDIYPTSFLGIVFSIVYVPVAVIVMSRSIMQIAVIPLNYRTLKLEEYVLGQFGEQLQAPDLTDLKASVNLQPDVGLRKNDFILAMLMRLGKVGKYDKARIEGVFHNLDKDRSGTLDEADLLDLLQKQHQRLQARGESQQFLRTQKVMQDPTAPPSPLAAETANPLAEGEGTEGQGGQGGGKGGSAG